MLYNDYIMKNTRIIFTFTIKYIFPNKITNYNINLQNHIPSNNLKINPTLLLQ